VGELTAGETETKTKRENKQMMMTKSKLRTNAKTKPKAAKDRGRYYAMRWLSDDTHESLEILAARMRTSKEAVVRQCLDIGVSFLEEAVSGKGDAVALDEREE
jgi:plasmid stability protein